MATQTAITKNKLGKGIQIKTLMCMNILSSVKSDKPVTDIVCCVCVHVCACCVCACVCVVCVCICVYVCECTQPNLNHQWYHVWHLLGRHGTELLHCIRSVWKTQRSMLTDHADRHAAPNVWYSMTYMHVSYQLPTTISWYFVRFHERFKSFLLYF